MSDLVDRLRKSNGWELVSIVHEAADRIEQLERVLAQAREALEDMNNGWKYIRCSHGDLYGVGWDRAQDKANASIAAIDEALNARVHPPPQAVGCNGGVGRLVNEGTEGNEQWTR